MSNSGPGTMTRRGVVLLLALPLAALLGTATAGSIYFGQIRYFPEGYTEPEVTTNANGSTNYKPSVPTGFKKHTFGTGVQVGNASVHPNAYRDTDGAAAAAPAAAPKIYYLNFKDGRRVIVQAGSRIQINGEMYVVAGMMNGDFYMQSVSTKKYLKLTRQDPAPEAGAPAAAVTK